MQILKDENEEFSLYADGMLGNLMNIKTQFNETKAETEKIKTDNATISQIINI